MTDRPLPSDTFRFSTTGIARIGRDLAARFQRGLDPEIAHDAKTHRRQHPSRPWATVELLPLSAPELVEAFGPRVRCSARFSGWTFVGRHGIYALEQGPTCDRWTVYGSAMVGESGEAFALEVGVLRAMLYLGHQAYAAPSSGRRALSAAVGSWPPPPATDARVVDLSGLPLGDIDDALAALAHRRSGPVDVGHERFETLYGLSFQSYPCWLFVGRTVDQRAVGLVSSEWGSDTDLYALGEVMAYVRAACSPEDAAREPAETAEVWRERALRAAELPAGEDSPTGTSLPKALLGDIVRGTWTKRIGRVVVVRDDRGIGLRDADGRWFHPAGEWVHVRDAEARAIEHLRDLGYPARHQCTRRSELDIELFRRQVKTFQREMSIVIASAKSSEPSMRGERGEWEELPVTGELDEPTCEALEAAVALAHESGCDPKDSWVETLAGARARLEGASEEPATPGAVVRGRSVDGKSRVGRVCTQLSGDGIELRDDEGTWSISRGEWYVIPKETVLEHLRQIGYVYCRESDLTHAVEQFQGDHNLVMEAGPALPTDGVLGPDTIIALCRTLGPYTNVTWHEAVEEARMRAFARPAVEMFGAVEIPSHASRLKTCLGDASGALGDAFRRIERVWSGGIEIFRATFEDRDEYYARGSIERAGGRTTAFDVALLTVPREQSPSRSGVDRLGPVTVGDLVHDTGASFRIGYLRRFDGENAIIRDAEGEWVVCRHDVRRVTNPTWIATQRLIDLGYDVEHWPRRACGDERPFTREVARFQRHVNDYLFQWSQGRIVNDYWFQWSPSRIGILTVHGALDQKTMLVLERLFEGAASVHHEGPAQFRPFASTDTGAAAIKCLWAVFLCGEPRPSHTLGRDPYADVWGAAARMKLDLVRRGEPPPRILPDTPLPEVPRSVTFGHGSPQGDA